MKMSLLELVQDILNDMDYDYVNSITDIPDALQVATIIRTTYFELLTNRAWPHVKRMARLEASGDNTKPNYLRLPERVMDLDWLKYNKKSLGATKDWWDDVMLVSPQEFMDRVMRRNSDTAQVTTIIDFNNTPLLIMNNKPPTWVTTFDDEWLVFDSWDSEIDTTLQASKCQAYVTYEPEFIIEDTFIPEMPAKAFPYLLAESKSVCFNTLKQLPNAKEEQRSRRQRIQLSRGKYRVGNYILDERPDWGRRK